MEFSFHCEQCDGGPEMYLESSDFESFGDRVRLTYKCYGCGLLVSVYIHK